VSVFQYYLNTQILIAVFFTLRAAAKYIVIGPVCLFACLQRAGRRAGGVRTLLQPARAQCLRLSERFFHKYLVFKILVHQA